MAKKEYNWSDDPWNEEKQAQDDEELRHANRMGLVYVALLLVIAIVALIATPIVLGIMVGSFGLL